MISIHAEKICRDSNQLLLKRDLGRKQDINIYERILYKNTFVDSRK